MSCPSRGTWIEMPTAAVLRNTLACRAPRGARGLKSIALRLLIGATWSCPSRGTWIEIDKELALELVRVVVPLAGHVD